MSFATLSRTLSRFLSSKRIKICKSQKHKKYGFEDNFKMVVVKAPASTRLDHPFLDVTTARVINTKDPTFCYPYILDYHGSLTYPSQGRYAWFEKKADGPSVFLEYRIKSNKKNTVILKFTGMSPQRLSISFDGREDNMLPILVFLPKHQGFLGDSL